MTTRVTDLYKDKLLFDYTHDSSGPDSQELVDMDA